MIAACRAGAFEQAASAQAQKSHPIKKDPAASALRYTSSHVSNSIRPRQVIRCVSVTR
jgi:hypothetical protein